MQVEIDISNERPHVEESSRNKLSTKHKILSIGKSINKTQKGKWNVKHKGAATWENKKKEAKQQRKSQYI